MRIERVKYTAQYDEFGVIKAVWAGMEGSLDDTEDPIKQLSAIKELTDKWYQKNMPQPGTQCPPMYFAGNVMGPRVIETERTSEDVIVADLIRNIYACTRLDGVDGLWTYSKLSSSYTEAQAAYAVMENKLRNQEVKQILDATNALTDSINADPALKNQLNNYNRNTKMKYEKKKGGHHESLDDNK